MKRRNSIFILLLSILAVISFSSCSKGNPVNAALQNMTSIFATKEHASVNSNTGNLMILAQKEEEKADTTKSGTVKTTTDSVSILDSIMSDSTKGLPFTVETYTYKSKGYRDPFISVLDLQRNKEINIDIESASFYGILKGKNGKLALLKDASGMGFVFFEGEKIKNGVLLKVEMDSIIFKLDEYGVVRNKVIRLNKNVDKKSKK